jgi:hypothetical protein
MDQRGAALTIAMLRDMANLLLQHRGDHTPWQNWPHNVSNDIQSLLVDFLANMTISAP